MITQDKAIENARLHIAGWEFVDDNAKATSTLVTRSETLTSGVKDSPNVRDRWLVSFPRIASGHPLEELFPFITVRVDAETGEASVLESL